jgi:Amt family ammonium transporter
MLDHFWLLLCSGLVFLMQAGFMCLESGLTRAKNNINVAVKNLADFGVSVLLFWMFGYALMFGASQNGWIGLADFFPNFDARPGPAAFFLFEAMFVGTATTIISGAVAERMTFNSYLVVAAVVSGLIYPLFGHWVWNDLVSGNPGGWLGNLGFVDFAGSTVVHSTGAWVSLATLLIVGARQGRFSQDGQTHKIQGSNMPFSVLGAFLLWFGWIGFNGGSTLAMNDQVPGIVVNTVLAAVAGMVTAAALSELQHGLLEVEAIINGSLAGLVAITACCHVVPTGLALVVGATGAAVTLLVDYWLTRWRIDDAVSAVAVHGGGGVWGTLCVALFGRLSVIDTGLNRLEQLLVQLLGIGVCLLWSFGVSWCVLVLLNRVLPLRVSARAESLGLNISEHRAKTDTYDLFQVMDQQARTQDLSLRVPIEPFTEIGHIATRYNQVMGNLEQQHRQQVDDLEQIYYLVAIASAAVETNTFQADELDLEDLLDRQDELGNLAWVLKQLIQTIQTRDQGLTLIWQHLDTLGPAAQVAVLVKLLETRFGPLPTSLTTVLSQSEADQLQPIWQIAMSAEDLQTVQTAVTENIQSVS